MPSLYNLIFQILSTQSIEAEGDTLKTFPNYLQLDELPAKENVSSECASTADVSKAHPSNSVSKNCNQNYEVNNVKLN